MQVKICPNCSAENRLDADACAKCSWNIAEVAPSEGRVAAPPRPMQAQVSRPSGGGSSAGLIIVLLIVLAGAAFAGWWFFLRGGGPGAVVDKFVASVKAGDFEGVKSTLNKSATDMIASVPSNRLEEAKASFMGAMKRNLGDQTIKVVKTSYDGDTAIVGVEVTGAQVPSENGSHDVVLVKENGAWKIDFQATAMRDAKAGHGTSP